MQTLWQVNQWTNTALGSGLPLMVGGRDFTRREGRVLKKRKKKTSVHGLKIVASNAIKIKVDSEKL